MILFRLPGGCRKMRGIEQRCYFKRAELGTGGLAPPATHLRSTDRLLPLGLTTTIESAHCRAVSVFPRTASSAKVRFETRECRFCGSGATRIGKLP